jgi:putative transposase
MANRYRLYPDTAQEAALGEHCAHARFVWNLGLEQRLMYRPGRGPTPRFAEQSRQLTEARAEFEWLRNGSRGIQEQALRDLDRAWERFFAHTHGKPTWRKRGQRDGFRVVGRRSGNRADWDVRRISRHIGEVRIPKIGRVRFRWSRSVPEDAKSYRVTLDRSGRWHVSFMAFPDPIPAPGNGEVVGVDRGVAVSAALSTGEMLTAPKLSPNRRRRRARLRRRLSRARRGSNRRARVKMAIARLDAREADLRKDWAEKVSTDLARRFDLIRVEDLKIKNMTRSAKGTAEIPGRNVRAKAALNRGILRSGWGLLVCRLGEKAPARVEKIKPHFTSQRCSVCGHIAAESRKSQALFACVACGFACNADVNAARNIAAGHAVTARGGVRVAGPVNHEPAARPLVAAGIFAREGDGGCQTAGHQCHDHDRGEPIDVDH